METKTMMIISLVMVILFIAVFAKASDNSKDPAPKGTSAQYIREGYVSMHDYRDNVLYRDM